MSVFNSMKISASGLSLERLKMDIISTNIANINTTRTEDGGPYLRKELTFEESLKGARVKLNTEVRGLDSKRHFALGNFGASSLRSASSGVKITSIVDDEENLKLIYDPNHPDANADGYVLMPNVNMVDEMVALLNVQRSYEANVTALNTSKNILKKALEISKG